MNKPKKKIIICWFCGNKMHGGCKPILLTIDGYARKLHKACVKQVKGDSDFHFVSDEEAVSTQEYDDAY